MWENLPSYLQQFEPYIVNFLVGLAIFIGGWIVSKWVAVITHQICLHGKLDEALARFLASLARYTLIAAALISSLATVGVQTTSLIAIFASAGLAVGLALQGNLANFASGVMILTFRPILLGERVSIAGSSGDVVDIGIFTTTLRTPSNEILIVPNSAITHSTITNYSRTGTLRSCLSFQVAPDSDPKKLMDLLVKAAKGCDLVLADPEPSAALGAIQQGALSFDLFFWSLTSNCLEAQQKVRLAVLTSLRAASVSGPQPQFPYQQTP